MILLVLSCYYLSGAMMLLVWSYDFYLFELEFFLFGAMIFTYLEQRFLPVLSYLLLLVWSFDFTCQSFDFYLFGALFLSCLEL